MKKVQQVREQLDIKTQLHQDKIKAVFDRNVMTRYFKPRYLVLKWDSKRQDKFKYGKFDKLWAGPFKSAIVQDNNAYELAHMDGELFGNHVNDIFHKCFFLY